MVKIIVFVNLFAIGLFNAGRWGAQAGMADADADGYNIPTSGLVDTENSMSDSEKKGHEGDVPGKSISEAARDLNSRSSRRSFNLLPKPKFTKCDDLTTVQPREGHCYKTCDNIPWIEGQRCPSTQVCSYRPQYAISLECFSKVKLHPHPMNPVGYHAARLCTHPNTPCTGGQRGLCGGRSSCSRRHLMLKGSCPVKRCVQRYYTKLVKNVYATPVGITKYRKMNVIIHIPATCDCRTPPGILPPCDCKHDTLSEMFLGGGATGGVDLGMGVGMGGMGHMMPPGWNPTPQTDVPEFACIA